MPRLIVMQGAHPTFFDLAGRRTTLGSHPDRDLVLHHDPDVAPHHCTFTRQGSLQRVEAACPEAAVTLNGTRVKQAQLSYGDKLCLGQTAVFFIASSLDEGVHPAARRLSTLLILQEITKELNSETEIEDLLELIMDAAINLIQAERGFLILVKGEQLEFRVARNIDAEVVRSPEFKISNSVIRRVVQSGEPILTSNAQRDLRDLKSVAALELRSLLCVPLRIKSKILGTLYLDSRAHESEFDEEKRDLLTAFSEPAAIAIENARLLHEAKERQSLLSELKVASRIQLALLPRKAPRLPGFSFAGKTKTAQELGGDYFDYIWGSQHAGAGALFVAIGDVSGKGVPAGLVMVMARSFLRSLIARSASLIEILAELNRLLKQDLKPGMFMSMLLVSLEPNKGSLLLAGCGHEHPLLYRAQTRRVERIDLGGLVLGVVPDLHPHLEELRLKLEPGDQLLFYTDGLTEAPDSQGQPFGLERVADLLLRHGDEPPDHLVEHLLRALAYHTGTAPRHDDVTLIALRRELA